MKIIDEVYPLIKCEARLSDDGTLWIKADNKSMEQITRVIIENTENCFCKTFYQGRSHGEWKHNKTYSSMEFCSECGMPFLHEDKYPRNYCPNCGADMREDKPHGFTADEWYRDTFGENDGK